MKLATRVSRRRGLRRLDGTPAGSAVHRAVERPLTPAEREWAERVDARRTQLETSAERVEMAVAPTTAEMWKREPGIQLNGPTASRLVREVTLRTSKPREWGEFLLRLVCDLKPRRIVELGTSVGLSGAYQAAGLSLVGSGQLVTIEHHPAVARVAQETFDRLGLPGTVVIGSFDDCLEDVLVDGADLAFVDGNHHEDATLRYHEALRGSPVVLYDDISWSKGMRRAWTKIRRDVPCSADLGGVGVVVRLQEPESPQA